VGRWVGGGAGDGSRIERLFESVAALQSGGDSSGLVLSCVE